MRGAPETAPLLDLGARAEALGFDSLWVGDSIVAKPRHDPLTLLAALAARTVRALLGTAVLLPALRNPVVLAHQVATLDQLSAGRLILGLGIAADLPNIRAEFAAAGVPFEKRVGRLLEGVRLWRALWSGKPVSWSGRWTLEEQALAPTPWRPEGPPLWLGSFVDAGAVRAGRLFDGWFPTGPDPETFRRRWELVRETAQAAGRNPDAICPALYLTLCIDADATRADAQLNAYFRDYYGPSADALKVHQAYYAGPAAGVADWIRPFREAGAEHLILRFSGDHERHLEAIAALRNAF